MTPKEVLEGPCQELYEVRKLITYPRSSSFYISRERYETLKQQAPALARLVGFSEEDLVFPERLDGFFVNDKKAANHSAVVPTTLIPTEEEVEALPDALKIVYKAVIRRTLAMFFPKYEYEQTTIITQVGAGRFKTVGQVPKNPGWQVLFQDSASLLDGVIEESEARELVKVQINDTVTSHLVPAERHVKKPPRHTNSTWLRALRTAGRDLEDEELIAIMNQIKGLGTAATRGAILDEIVVNKWVTVKQGKIYLSELGWLICETLKDERVLSQPETTAIWEQSLSKIAEGTNTQEKFLKNIYRYLGIENPHNNLIENLIKAVDRTDYIPFQDFIEQAVAKADGKLGNCPLCGKAVKVLGKSKVAQCEDNILSKEEREREAGATPVCSFNFWITVGFIKDKKKTLTKKQISDLLSDKGRTNLIKNIEGKYGPFDAYAYLSFNEEKGIYQVNLEVDKATSKK
ncbi:DNA topoisomerase [Streptococcus salivarius]|jgi:topoisomerase (fragment)|uniref:DNA topoisomerase n=1 Tax=Streptococcus salivarius TaxID=1304 RepID=UPI00093C851C|nr:DNA topoisomerase [Streptococcus salivarius]